MQELCGINIIILKKHINYELHNYRALENGECGIIISKKGNISVINKKEDSDTRYNSLDSCIEILEDKNRKREYLKKTV